MILPLSMVWPILWFLLILFYGLHRVKFHLHLSFEALFRFKVAGINFQAKLAKWIESNFKVTGRVTAYTEKDLTTSSFRLLPFLSFSLSVSVTLFLSLPLSLWYSGFLKSFQVYLVWKRNISVSCFFLK